MVFTSVAGHLLELNFTAPYTSWQACSPQDLFTVPVAKHTPKVRNMRDLNLGASANDSRLLLLLPIKSQHISRLQSSLWQGENEKIMRNLQTQARSCQQLILWLDCDREGENIAFEVRGDIWIVLNVLSRHTGIE